jgi:hypothetical protein
MNEREKSDRYLNLMNFRSPEEAYSKVKELASSLSDDQHRIRSCIFDLHAVVELELRRIFYHTFRAQLFLTNDEDGNEKTTAAFDKAVSRLSFMDMYRVLKPILNSWPYPDLEAISDVNDARVAAAHGNAIDRVRYKGRNPFEDADCFAQMYFDVWAMKQSFAKFFDRAISGPRERLKQYVEKYGHD